MLTQWTARYKARMRTIDVYKMYQHEIDRFNSKLRNFAEGVQADDLTIREIHAEAVKDTRFKSKYDAEYCTILDTRNKTALDPDWNTPPPAPKA